MKRSPISILIAESLNYLTPMLVLLVALLLGAAFVFGESDAERVWEWLRDEGTAIFLWWLLTSLAACAVMPLLFRLLPTLPSRGYALARAAGVMLVGFVFWFAASLGLWANTPGAIVLAWLIVLVFALYVWRRGEARFEGWAWLRENGAFVLTVEILFIALLVGWAMFRAHEPEVRSTEKPMEMMFLNSIRHSEFFPPNDGWLAGYSISYYYFGYVIMAGLADLSAVNSGIAFGLMSALLFALSGIGILGVVYDLVRASKGGRTAALGAGLLGMVLLIFAGNLGTFFIELPWNGRGLVASLASVDYFEFWSVPERSRLVIDLTPNDSEERWRFPKTGEVFEGTRPDSTYTPVRDENGNLRPDWEEGGRDFTDWDYWWWFRYSRVIGDSRLNDEPIGVQPIAEVPHFSFILSDMHPHVLALPFAVLALGLAAGLALRERDLEWWGYVLLAIWVGGMVFMNSWDAVYIPFLVGVEALRRLMRGGRLRGEDWLGIAAFAVIIFVLTVVFYAPWILSFTSQAGGVYFNIIWNTAPPQLFLQFGSFFLLLLPFIGLELWRGRHSLRWMSLILVFIGLFLLIVVALPFAAAWMYEALCDRGSGAACLARDILFGGAAPDTYDHFWREALARRATSYLSEGLMLAVIVLAGFRLFGGRRDAPQDRPELPYSPSTGVALLVAAAGLALIMLPDFAYLVDNFRVRINTVFKLYYQGWIFLSVASAYAVYVMLIQAGGASRWAWVGRLAYGLLGIAVLGMALVYPYYAVRARSLDESGRYQAQAAVESCAKADIVTNCPEVPKLTLDGRFGSFRDDELQVALCLLALNPPPDAVVAEAPYNGGYNADYGRIATLTGVPNLLGWINHEGQWRGAKYDQVTEVLRDPISGAILDSREIQADRLYKTTDWAEAQAVITRYGIDYVMVGSAERLRYADAPEGLEKFGERFTPICQAGEAALYAVGG